MPLSTHHHSVLLLVLQIIIICDCNTAEKDMIGALGFVSDQSWLLGRHKIGTDCIYKILP